jgi:Phospholipase_D-nuclease N-terminal
VTIVATKKRWSDFTGRQQAAILAGTAIEVILTTVALADLARRPRAQVRGPKPLWVLGCVVQPVGPIAYLMFGRCSS